MNTTNIIGIRIAGITLILIVAAFGMWKGALFLIAQTPKAPIPAPTPEQTILSPSPATPLPPELQQQISSYTDSAKQSIGAYTKKYVESLPADVEKDQVLNAKSVEAFVVANQGTLLPLYRSWPNKGLFPAKSSRIPQPRNFSRRIPENTTGTA